MSWLCKLKQVPEQQKRDLLLGFTGFLTIKTRPNRTETSRFKPVSVLNFLK
jgi:hypothetical protein